MLRNIDIETIRALNIVDYAKSKMVLKSRGVNHFGLCPFHGEKTPSFAVSGAKNTYKCYGCGEHGSIIDLAMHFENASFPTACKILAAKYGVDVVEVIPEEDVLNKNCSERAILANKTAQNKFQKDFFENIPAKAYIVKERGYMTKEEVEFWGIGYCNGELPCEKEEAEFAGMLSERGNLLFTGRITFPVHDVMGNIIGFTARVIGKNNNSSKYVNSKESIAFKKMNTLYNLHRAKKAIKTNNQFVLVEGPTDVHAMRRINALTCVAPLGTSFTEEQCRLLSLYSKNGYIMTDGDKAGKKAAVRAVGIFWKYAFNIKVIEFPDGEDPDSMIKKYNNKFDAYCQEHHPESFVYKYYLSEYNNDEEKAINQVIGMIAECKQRLNREIYLKKLAFISGFSADALRDTLNDAVSKVFFQQRI